MSAVEKPNGAEAAPEPQQDANAEKPNSKLSLQLESVKKNAVIQFLKKPHNLLVVLTATAVVLGCVLGLVLKWHTKLTKDKIYFIAFPGDLLMNVLKMLIIPLIISSLITGLAGLDQRSSGRVGLYALIYYMCTTLIAVLLGIALVLIIHPGSPKVKANLGNGTRDDRRPSTVYAFLDLFKNMLPPNLVKACLQQSQTEYKYKSNSQLKAAQEAAKLANRSASSVGEFEMRETWNNETNVLGLVVFSMFFGFILGRMGERAYVMLQFFSVLNDIVMDMVRYIMWYSPIGIMFLIMSKILLIDDLSETVKSLGLYMVTVIVGLIIHTLFVLSLSYFIITRKNPFKFFKGMSQAFITALGTASSAATLPLTFQCLEENNHLDRRVTRFVLPIGATINMDGTALYEAVASIFIAQINDRKLTVAEVFTVSLTATLAAIGAASVPSAGLVTMMLVLSAVNLPIEDVSLILAVDWLLDRCRTSVNVLGDAYGAGIVNHLCRKDLAKCDIENVSEAAEYLENVFNDTQDKSNEDVELGRMQFNQSAHKNPSSNSLILKQSRF